MSQAKHDDGCYSCKKGIELIAKVLAGSGKMTYCKAMVGDGYLEQDEDPSEQDKVKGNAVKADIAAVTNPVGGECQVTIQLNSKNVETGFYATGILLYAQDEDGSEVPYTYLVLENNPEWIRPKDSSIGKLATFDLIVAVGKVDNVTAVIDTDAVMTRQASEKLLEDSVGKPAEYSAEESEYSIGDTVTHDGKTYRCTTPITENEAWNEAHWQRVDLYREAGDLQSESEAQREIHNRTYRGVNLAEKFESEIADYIKGEGSSKFSDDLKGKANDESELKAWLWMQHRINRHDYYGIHIGDWLPFTVKCNQSECSASCPFYTGECAGAFHDKQETHKMQVSGMDTYFDTIYQEWHWKYSGREQYPVHHHIDFISKDLLSPPIKWNTTAYNSGEYCGKWICDSSCPNYASRESCSSHKALADITSYTSACASCSKVTTCEFGKNKEKGPDFCIDAGTDSPYCTSHVRAFLDFIYEHSAKDAYDGIISPKTMIGERRAFNSTESLTDSTGWHWYDWGKFWLPTEFEVYGATVWGTQGWSSGQAVQYPIFAGRWDDKIKHIGPDSTTRSGWWLSCARSGSASNACFVDGYGYAGAVSAAHAGVRVPLCFRIAASDNQ